MLDIATYIRPSDSATMIAIAPGVFVNQQLLTKLGLVSLKASATATPPSQK